MSTVVNKKKAAPKGVSGNFVQNVAPAQAAAERPFQRNALKKLTPAFDNLIWPHFDTYNWPHLINKDAGPVRQKSYGPSRDGVQRKGRRLSPFLCTSNVEATPSAATMLSFSVAPPGFCESGRTRRQFR